MTVDEQPDAVAAAAERAKTTAGRNIPAFDDLLFVEFNVLPLRRNPEKSEAQAVRPVFGDEVERLG